MATSSIPYSAPFQHASAGPDSVIDPLWAAAESNPFRKQFFYFSLLYVFLRFSLMNEAFAILTGINIRPALLLGLPAVVGVLVTGGLGRILRSRIGWMWMGFAAMMVLSTPFSTWKGGSVEHIAMYFKSEFTMLLVMGGLAVTWREVKLLYLTLAASGLFSVVMAKILLKQTGDDGRMELDIPGSSIANSNDMAAHMLLLLPFLLFLLFRPRQNLLIRFISLAAALTSVYVTLASGSRGALVALGVMGVMLFLQTTGVRKIAFLLMIPLLGAGVYSSLSIGVKARLFNYDNSYEEGSSRSEAAGSLLIRNELMEHALLYTLTHPLLGIGPGQFPVYDDRMSKAAGQRRGSWHNPHIVYLQVSSECGIPALLFYLGGILGSLYGVWKVWKQTAAFPQLRDMRVAAQTLILTQVSFYIAILFLPIAYKMLLPALSGLSIALMFVAQKEINQILRRQKPGIHPAGTPTPQPALNPIRFDPNRIHHKLTR